MNYEHERPVGLQQRDDGGSMPQLTSSLLRSGPLCRCHDDTHRRQESVVVVLADHISAQTSGF